MADAARHVDAGGRPRLSRVSAHRQHDRRGGGGRRGWHPFGDPLTGRRCARRPPSEAANPAGDTVAPRTERRVAGAPGRDRPRELRGHPGGGDRVRRHRCRGPAHAPGAGGGPGRSSPRRQRGGPRRGGDERYSDRRAVRGGAPDRIRRPCSVLRVSRCRVSRTDRRAPHGDPRRGPAAEACGRDRVGRAGRRAPSGRVRSARSWRGDRGLGARILRRVVHALSAGPGENAAARRSAGARNHVQRRRSRRPRGWARDRIDGARSRSSAADAGWRRCVCREPVRGCPRRGARGDASGAGRHQLRVRCDQHVDDNAAADGHRPSTARPAARYLRDDLRGASTTRHRRVRSDAARGPLQRNRCRRAAGRRNHGARGGHAVLPGSSQRPRASARPDPPRPPIHWPEDVVSSGGGAVAAMCAAAPGGLQLQPARASNGRRR